MVESSILFQPEIDDRALDREVRDVDDTLDDAGTINPEIGDIEGEVDLEGAISGGGRSRGGPRSPLRTISRGVEELTPMADYRNRLLEDILDGVQAGGAGGDGSLLRKLPRSLRNLGGLLGGGAVALAALLADKITSVNLSELLDGKLVGEVLPNDLVATAATITASALIAEKAIIDPSDIFDTEGEGTGEGTGDTTGEGTGEGSGSGSGSGSGQGTGSGTGSGTGAADDEFFTPPTPQGTVPVDDQAQGQGTASGGGGFLSERHLSGEGRLALMAAEMGVSNIASLAGDAPGGLMDALGLSGLADAPGDLSNAITETTGLSGDQQGLLGIAGGGTAALGADLAFLKALGAGSYLPSIGSGTAAGSITAASLASGGLATLGLAGTAWGTSELMEIAGGGEGVGPARDAGQAFGEQFPSAGEAIHGAFTSSMNPFYQAGRATRDFMSGTAPGGPYVPGAGPGTPASSFTQTRQGPTEGQLQQVTVNNNFQLDPSGTADLEREMDRKLEQAKREALDEWERNVSTGGR